MLGREREKIFTAAVRMRDGAKQLFHVGGVFTHEQAIRAVSAEVRGARVALVAERRPLPEQDERRVA